MAEGRRPKGSKAPRGEKERDSEPQDEKPAAPAQAEGGDAKPPGRTVLWIGLAIAAAVGIRIAVMSGRQRPPAQGAPPTPTSEATVDSYGAPAAPDAVALLGGLAVGNT